MIKSFHHASFTVTDLDRSVAFYRDFLRMSLLSIGERDPVFSEKVTGVEGAHLKIAYLEAGGMKLELIQYLSPLSMKNNVTAQKDGSSHIAFIVDDLAEVHKALKESGVKFRSEPVEIPTGGLRGGYTVILNDPDGNAVELIQPPHE